MAGRRRATQTAQHLVRIFRYMTAKEKSELPKGAILRLTSGKNCKYIIVLHVELGAPWSTGYVQYEVLPLHENQGLRDFPIKEGRGVKGWKPTRIA